MIHHIPCETDQDRKNVKCTCLFHHWNRDGVISLFRYFIESQISIVIIMVIKCFGGITEPSTNMNKPPNTSRRMGHHLNSSMFHLKV